MWDSFYFKCGTAYSGTNFFYLRFNFLFVSICFIQAKINKNHEVLEIGYGWGSFAIEVVKQTGCRYTGITLSEEQLKFAEKKVKDAGLQVSN